MKLVKNFTLLFYIFFCNSLPLIAATKKQKKAELEKLNFISDNHALNLILDYENSDKEQVEKNIKETGIFPNEISKIIADYADSDFQDQFNECYEFVQKNKHNHDELKKIYPQIKNLRLAVVKLNLGLETDLLDNIFNLQFEVQKRLQRKDIPINRIDYWFNEIDRNINSKSIFVKLCQDLNLKGSVEYFDKLAESLNVEEYWKLYAYILALDRFCLKIAVINIVIPDKNNLVIKGSKSDLLFCAINLCLNLDIKLKILTKSTEEEKNRWINLTQQEYIKIYNNWLFGFAINAKIY